EERLAPGAGRAAARGARGTRDTRLAVVALARPADQLAAVIGRELEGAAQPRAHRMIGGLEADQQHALAVEPHAVQPGLVTVEQSRVAGQQAGLRERARRRDACRELAERDARARPPARPR